MTDLFRGYDLTTVVDTVAEKQYARMKADAERNLGIKPDQIVTWEDLKPVDKRNYKEGFLPIVTDVLEALESDQVKPTEGKQMVEYGYTNSKDPGGDDPRWYENQHPEQHDQSTATVWTLHMHIHPKVKDAVLERMSVMPEVTGEYTYSGDSWREWGEKTDDETDQHLAVYFHATPAQAAAIGFHLANHATIAAMQSMGGNNADIVTYAVSTSGDYAMQLPNL